MLERMVKNRILLLVIIDLRNRIVQKWIIRLFASGAE